MGFIYSPMKLIGLFKERDSIVKELKKNNSNWYFTNEGEDAYNAAKTPAQKTVYFFNYLTSITEHKDKREVLYKIAYIMANSMDSSSLEFAGYPNILDPEKNPLVNYVKTTGLVASDQVAYGLMLLAALNNEKDARLFLYAKHKPYNRITYLESDGSASDKYKIERDIIGAFCTGFSGKFMPPYTYEITEPTADDVDDDVDD